MADTQFVTDEGAVIRSTALKTRLALSKLRLCASPFTPTRITTKAQFEAAEAAFDGYPAGGYEITAMLGPAPGGTGGSEITSPIVMITNNTPSDPPVGATVSAWWLENAAGGVELAGTFSPPRPLTTEGMGFPFFFQDIEGLNAPASL